MLYMDGMGKRAQLGQTNQTNLCWKAHEVPSFGQYTRVESKVPFLEERSKGSNPILKK